ncbi:hypothetical protein GYA37_02820 [candidate division WWE3 bacterium]|uniref:DNA polymerase III delta subunit-like C-terminal domain-containing protein n=1 Tax=candidate division WWE3 bacterium TaxID=2053526 RepID=A0A7X9E787_UNCKA|nr:hypothetical protein [candidate division WWE3 bacterium]
MIYIVHGDDLPKSRALIQNQQKKLNIESRIEVNISDITPEDLYEKGHSSDLFGNPPFIVIDITSAGRMNMDKFIEVITKLPLSTTLIILSAKSLPKTNAFIKNAAKLKAKTNLNDAIPTSSTFKLVDFVFYKQRENAYNELSKLISDQISPYEIFSLFFYGLRSIASAKFGSPSFVKLHDFVKRKSLSQANLYTTKQLVSIFEEFRKIDMRSKLSEIDEELIIPMAIETVLNS